MNWFKTDDIRIQDIEPLISPAILIKDYPATTEIAKMVATTRKNAENIISGHDDRLLVVVGPCSIHDPQAAVDYASRLKEQMARFEKDLVIIMRVYFEKPRTTVGWKGLINDPFREPTFDISHLASTWPADCLLHRGYGSARSYRVPGHHHAAVHCGPDHVGRHRRAHLGKPGTP